MATAWAVACGGSTPEPDTASTASGSEISADDADTDASFEAPHEAAGPGKSRGECDATCAKLIDDATLALERAEALEGAERARPAMALRAGQGFLRAWGACYLKQPDGSDLACKGGSSVVSNMARAFELSGHDDKTIYAHLVALDGRWGDAAGQDSSAALRAAAERAEATAKQQSKMKQAPSLLEHAIYARLALQDPDQASQKLALFRRRYAGTHGDAAVILGAAVARYHLLHVHPGFAS